MPEQAFFAGGDRALAREGVRASEALAGTALAAAAEHGSARAVSLALADAAATLCRCRRVAIGVGEGRRVRLLAISGETRPDGRRAVPRQLRAVVGEALARGADCRWPEADGNAANAPTLDAHRRLHRSEGGLRLLSVVRVGASGVGAVAVLERDARHVFSDAEARAIGESLRPALALVALLERSPLERAAARLASAVAALRRAPRERPSARFAVAGGAVTVAAFALFVPLPHEVPGRVVIEAAERQVLVAPRAGFLRTAHARAGDTVRAGEPLATLDDRELALDRERWESEARKNRAEQARALAAHDRVELARLRADAERIAAERALVESRRARGELRAPFDGVVLAGDPTRSLGAPLEAGEVLFEIASGEGRELYIEIDEHDVALLEPGALARVRMAAEPDRVREARLGTAVPVAVAEPGGSVFRVPARFVANADGAALNPGMEGVARVRAGHRTLASAWTRRLRTRLLLLAWRFGLLA